MTSEGHTRKPDLSDETSVRPIDNKTISSKGVITSISEHRDIEPLEKFNDPAAHRGRRRLIRSLIQDISQTTDPTELARLRRERSFLERMQYDSRVLKTNQRPRRGRY